MNDTQKMLQAIINGQSAIKQELSGKIDSLDLKMGKLDEKLDRVEKNLTDRIDKLGKQLAYLEDDAPTREEFDNLEEKVSSLEQKTVSV